MTPSLRVRLLAAAALGLVAACSSSSSGDDHAATSVTQDLTADPNGFVTTVVFDRSFASMGPGAFEADGGQTATAVTLDGVRAQVTWDGRVTSADRVRVVGVGGVTEDWLPVRTQDARVPVFTVASATQDVSDLELGGDELVLQFSGGPRVATEDAEDPTSWTLTALGVPQDLSDSTFDLDEATQALTITLGPSAQLFATFDVQAASLSAVTGRALDATPITGFATGDATPPALEGGTPIVQNLDPQADGDELGRVIELDFDEPISPTFGVTASNFGVVDHANAQGLTLVTGAQVDANDHTLVRVTFSRPVVPGLDQIRVSSVRDAHGNLMPTTTLGFVPSASVPNGYTSVSGLTREGAQNDQIVIVLDQAIDPDTAEDPSRWALTLGAPYGVVDLATQRIAYDLVQRTVTMNLDFDVTNGTTVDVQATNLVDVDGEDFSMAAPQVAATGDTTAPSVTSGITQRRDLDASGATVDVVFSEAVDPASAEATGNYTFTPAIVVGGATVQGDGATVRLSLAEAAVPGVHTLTVAGAVGDPAGNLLGAPHGPAAVASTDAVRPAAQFTTAQALEGANDDLVQVVFDDWMFPADVEDVANWTAESPIGSALDVSTSTVTYDVAARIATLVLDGAALKRGDSLSVAFTNARDLGGNVILADAANGVVRGETRRPTVESVWRQDAPNDNLLVVRFSEPVDRLEDLYEATTNPTGARFSVHTSGGVLRGRPTSSTAVDEGLGVVLQLPFAVALTDTLDIVGLEDLAGNVMFPSLTRVIDAADATTPAQGAAPLMTAVTGERNDEVVVTFSVPMASWRLTDPGQYTLQASGGGAVVDLTGSQFEYDGGTTLTIRLSAAAAASLQAGTTYDLVLEVDAQDPLRTAQGLAIAAPSSELNVVVVGDVASGPTQGASRAVLDPSDANSLLVIFDEAVDQTAAETAAGYDFDGGNIALSATLVSPRVVRATFGVAVTAGATLDVSPTAAVDLAGNASGATLSLTVVDDQAGLVIVSVAGAIDPAVGRDVVTVAFNEVPDLTTALTVANYDVIDSRGSVQIQGALYSSVDNTIRLYTADLLDGDTINVFVDGVADVAGNLPLLPLTDGGLVGGDSVPPTISGAFVNVTADATGRVIDVEFSEPVLTAFAVQTSNWSTTGAASVTAVEALALDHLRLTLSAALGATEQVVLAAGLTDRAGNAAPTALSADPTE